MTRGGDWALLAGLLLASLAIMLLALALRRESVLRAAADAALHGRQDEAEARTVRIALFERRLAAMAPLDALWLGWKRGCRPAAAALTAAFGALAEARLVFPADFAAELDEASALLLAYERHQSELHAALDSGRRYDRDEQLEREVALEQALKPRIADLRARLADAARLPDA